MWHLHVLDDLLWIKELQNAKSRRANCIWLVHTNPANTKQLTAEGDEATICRSSRHEPKRIPTKCSCESIAKFNSIAQTRYATPYVGKSSLHRDFACTKLTLGTDWVDKLRHHPPPSPAHASGATAAAAPSAASPGSSRSDGHARPAYLGREPFARVPERRGQRCYRHCAENKKCLRDQLV